MPNNDKDIKTTSAIIMGLIKRSWKENSLGIITVCDLRAIHYTLINFKEERLFNKVAESINVTPNDIKNNMGNKLMQGLRQRIEDEKGAKRKEFNGINFFEEAGFLLEDGIYGSAFGRLNYIYRSKGHRKYWFANGKIAYLLVYAKIDENGFDYVCEDVLEWVDLSQEIDLKDDWYSELVSIEFLINNLCNIKKDFIHDWPIEYLLIPPDVNELSIFSTSLRSELWDNIFGLAQEWLINKDNKKLEFFKYAVKLMENCDIEPSISGVLAMFDFYVKNRTVIDQEAISDLLSIINLNTLKPTNNKVINSHFAEIEELVTQLSQYSRHDGRIFDTSYIIKWLKQFETDEHINYAIKLLRNIDFYSRSRISSLFFEMLKTIKSEESSYVTLLGNPTDSSSLVNYVIRDVLVDYNIPSAELRSILALSELPENIIFIDDNIGSGRQSIEIFQQWLSTEKRILDEDHVSPLNEKEIALLKTIRIHIITCVTTRQGCEYVKKELTELGLNIGTVSGFNMVDQNVGCFHPTSIIFPDVEKREAAKAMCLEIGVSLFEDKKNWSDEKKQKNALGYGNEQKLIVFFYNVPTSTLPIFWKDGFYNGKEWFALFPRRDKVNIPSQRNVDSK